MKSWSAEGRLNAVYASMGVSNGRDELARRSGVDPQTLSALNSGGRRMTVKMAGRILEVAPGFSLLDLGAPEGEATETEDLRVVDRLRALEEAVKELLAAQAPDVLAALADHNTRLERLERSRGRRRATGGG